jgi:hypothetical protein
MAESITEGTLKQWTKQVGDHVEQDEEVATIETDKVGLWFLFAGPFWLRSRQHALCCVPHNTFASPTDVVLTP